MIPENLTTKRLYLRRTMNGDAGYLFQYYFSDQIAAKYLTRKPHTDINQSQYFLNKWCDLAWSKEKCSFSWVIALQDSNEAVGVFLVEYVDSQLVKIHYGIGHRFANRGLITEAGFAVRDWLLNHNVEKILTECNCDNLPSVRVLEKLGFKNEGIFKNKLVFPAFSSEARDCYLFSYTGN